MARRWTPRRFVTLRRIRVAICAAAVTLASVGMFAVTARKTVALTVNGETKTVVTYATSVPRLLQEQGVKTKSHDFIDSTDDRAGLKDHDVVTVRSAYQTTINIEGQEVPFWTYATSADQLLGFFKANDKNAAKVSVNVGNVYNQLTGGFVINKDGPVTVIADGKTSVAPNGKLTAASILDSKNITIGKDDRVSVSEENGQTILRVQRVTHGQETKDVSLPFSTRTVVDSNLQPGQTEIRQAGQNGNKQQVYDVTYVDGQAESSTLKSETVTQAALDQVVAVGPAAPAAPAAPSTPTTPAPSGGNGNDNGSDTGTGTDNGSSSNNDSGKDDNSNDNSTSSVPAPSTPSQPQQPSQPSTPSVPAQQPSQQPQQPQQPQTPQQPSPAPAPAPAPSTPGHNGLWHASATVAQTYACAMVMQHSGWGWGQGDCQPLINIWNKESGWRWNAQYYNNGRDDPYNNAYGIPQSYPGRKMADLGNDWLDNAGTQIDWGLNYIHNKYGSPTGAWRHWQQTGSY